MRLKIISDGTNDGTRIENAETGEPVLDVIGFEIKGKIGEPFVDITLKLIDVEMDITGEAKGHAAQIERLMTETYYKPGS